MSRLPPELENHLADYRKTAGLTQEQLAQAVGVSRQTVVAIERGDYSPSTVLALRLSVLLDIPIERLFALPAEVSNHLAKQRQRLLGKEETDA